MRTENLILRKVEYGKSSHKKAIQFATGVKEQKYDIREQIIVTMKNITSFNSIKSSERIK